MAAPPPPPPTTTAKNEKRHRKKTRLKTPHELRRKTNTDGHVDDGIAGVPRTPNVKRTAGWMSIVDPHAVLPKPDAFTDNASRHQPQHGLTVVVWANRLIASGLESILREYRKLAATDNDPDDNKQSAFRSNQKLNRYNNVGLNDLTRVLLSDNLGGDYIHASYVDGYKQKNAYILTQGPMETTVFNFWRMVWQERAMVIVMLTGIKENGVEKCAIYFPFTNKEDLDVGGVFRLSLVDVERHGHHYVLLIKAVCALTNEHRYVLLVIYGKWPDGCTPQPPCELINFAIMVKQCRATMLNRSTPKWNGHPRGPPVIVHCSAGIGRSATYAVLDICLDMLMHQGRVDIEEVTQKVRAQRRGSIQNAWQYLYLHYVILMHARNVGYLPYKADGKGATATTVAPPKLKTPAPSKSPQ